MGRGQTWPSPQHPTAQQIAATRHSRAVSLIHSGTRGRVFPRDVVLTLRTALRVLVNGGPAKGTPDGVGAVGVVKGAELAAEVRAGEAGRFLYGMAVRPRKGIVREFFKVDLRKCGRAPQLISSPRALFRASLTMCASHLLPLRSPAMRRAAFFLLLPLAAAVGAAKPEARLVVKPDAFKTLVNPNCSHCKDEAKRRAGELRDDDRVLCWTRGYSDGGAIPFRFFLNPYRVISDTYGVFVHDPDAGFARGFAPSVDFTFHGWRNGVMVMKHKDGTLYSCLTGLAFDGPRKGDRLKPIATLVSDWGPWTGQYPHNVAYHMFDKYQPEDLPAKPNADSVKSRGPLDKRLPADDLVLGVVAGKEARAYPLEALAKAGLVKDTLDGAALVVLWQGETKTAAAYRPVATTPDKDSKAKPRPVTLTLDDRKKWAAFTDKETGSHWDVAGRAIEGELKGWTLEWVDSTVVRWFAFAAEVPHTTITAGRPPRRRTRPRPFRRLRGRRSSCAMCPRSLAFSKPSMPGAGTSPSWPMATRKLAIGRSIRRPRSNATAGGAACPNFGPASVSGSGSGPIATSSRPASSCSPTRPALRTSIR